MGILNDIDSAAYDLERGRINGLYPVSNNFTIVSSHDAPMGMMRYDVYSYTTLVASVYRDGDGRLTTLVSRDTFHHSTTTSRHVRRFLSSLISRVDFDALYKACDRECDKEIIHGNGQQFINIREVV